MPEPLHPDHGLVAAALRREPMAVAWLAEQLTAIPRMVASLARRHRYAQVADLEDLAQTAAETGIDRLGSYHGLSPLAAWLHKICERKLQSFCRRKGLREIAPLERDPVDDQHDPKRLAEQAEQIARLQPAIDAIGGPEAEVLRMRHVEGRDFADIAAATGIPMATLRTRYYRGLEKLRLRLLPPDDRQADHP